MINMKTDHDNAPFSRCGGNSSDHAIATVTVWTLAKAVMSSVTAEAKFA
jgi:hypothetical protein